MATLTRKIHKSQLELYVEAYLKKWRNTNNRGSQIRFVNKAIKEIDWFLGVPCCIDPNAHVTWNAFDNALTLFVEKQLRKGVNRDANRKSFLRTKKLLQDFLHDPCCI